MRLLPLLSFVHRHHFVVPLPLIVSAFQIDQIALMREYWIVYGLLRRWFGFVANGLLVTFCCSVEMVTFAFVANLPLPIFDNEPEMLRDFEPNGLVSTSKYIFL